MSIQSHPCNKRANSGILITVVPVGVPFSYRLHVYTSLKSTNREGEGRGERAWEKAKNECSESFRSGGGMVFSTDGAAGKTTTTTTTRGGGGGGGTYPGLGYSLQNGLPELWL